MQHWYRIHLVDPSVKNHLDIFNHCKLPSLDVYDHYHYYISQSIIFIIIIIIVIVLSKTQIRLWSEASKKISETTRESFLMRAIEKSKLYLLERGIDKWRLTYD